MKTNLHPLHILIAVTALAAATASGLTGTPLPTYTTPLAGTGDTLLKKDVMPDSLRPGGDSVRFKAGLQMNDPGVNIWPETPHASKLRAVTMPAPALSTGAVTFEVPLYTLTTGGLDIPFSLRYHSNGIKDREDPYPAGCGWTFLPALRITRQIMGRPDGTYPFTGDKRDTQMTHGELHRCMVARTGLNGNRGLDPERDIFTVHMPEASFNAYYENGRLHAPGHSEYRMECDTLITSIKVTDPAGRVWDFSHRGLGTTDGSVTEWAPDKVTLPSGRTVTFTWESGTRIQWSVGTAKTYYYRLGTTGPDPSATSDGSMMLPQQITDKGLNLTSVTFPGGSVTLSYTSGMLKTLTVKAGSTTVATVTLTHGTSDTEKMMLQTVTLADGGKYTFGYQPCSGGSTDRVDYWGYRSKGTGAGEVYSAPTMRVGSLGNTTTEVISGAERSPDSVKMKERILIKATYPTGGVTEWEYEPHRFTPVDFCDTYHISGTKDTKLSFGGGLRVKKVTLRTSATDQNPRTVRYVYGKNGNGLANVEALPLASTFLSQAILVAPAGTLGDSPHVSAGNISEYGRLMAVPTSSYASYRFGEDLIWYEETAEIHAEGKTVHRFKKTVSNKVAIQGLGNILPDIMGTVFGGSPVESETEVYRSDGSGYTLAEKRAYAYTATDEGTSYGGLYIKRERVQSSAGRTSPDFDEGKYCFLTPNLRYEYGERDIYTVRSYNVSKKVTRLTSVTTTEYTGNGQYTVTEKYGWLPGTQLRSSVTVSNTGGSIKTETFYTDSVSSTVAKAMNDANVRGTVTGGRETCGTSVQEYQLANTSMRSGLLFRPSSLRQRRGSGSYVTSKAYTWNTDGTLKSWKGNDGVTTAYTWDSNGMYPLTQTVGGTLTSTATWKTLVGVSSLTDPSGVKTVYGYDSYNRLSSVAVNGKVAETYLYSISQTGANSITTRRYSSPSSYVSNVERYDGLGRVWGVFSELPSGAVGVLTEYDNMGRAYRTWEPAPTTMSVTSASSLKSAATSATTDGHPYSQNAYEASPRGIVVSSTMSGDAWHNSGKKKTTAVYINDGGTRACAKYTPSSTGVTKSGNWATGALRVTLATDEDGITTETYTDLRGNAVCVKHGGKATCYVYDDYGDLRYILPPGAEAGGLRTSATMKDLVYWYDYDTRGRLVTKKLPGAKESRYLYDSADRLTAEKSHDLAVGTWRLYAYDGCGRRVLQMDCALTDTEASAYAGTCRTATASTSGAFEGYTISPAPASKITGSSVTLAWYYDRHDMIPADGETRTYKNLSTLGITLRVASSLRGNAVNSSAKGKLAGMYTGEGWEIYFYDKDGREHQRSSTGYNIGRRTTFYNHDGSVASVHETHRGIAGSTEKNIYRDRDTYNTYDKAGRVTGTRVIEWKETTGANAPTVKGDSAVFTYTYDRLGRVSTLKSGNVTRTMTYDIHGWTTSLKTALSGKTMTEKLYYADSSKPRYNGFVSRRDLDGYSYLYTYNNRGFLTEAKYSGGESGSDYTETFSYNDRGGLLTLKRMGVTDLLPSGSKSYGTLDDISGSYTGNRLTSVTVSTGAQVYDRRTGIRKSGTYSLGYDASGRLTSDGTRGVTSVTYDNNGMLTSEKSSGVQMTVTRDGLGRKTATTLNIYNSSGGVQSTETKGYTGNGHVVSKNAIVMSRFPGGFFDSAGNPYYYLTDFQGNNIGVYDKTGKLVQRTDYYASGEPWLEPEYSNSALGNRYLFGGKERMAGGALNEYDFEARNYVASFQRFTTIDPEAEKFPWLSPYAYCNGNPINFIDPTGEDIVILNYGYYADQHLAMLIQNEEGKYQYYSINGNNVYISGKFSGGRTFNDVAVGSWDSPQEFLDDEYNNRMDETDNEEGSKENTDYNHFGFEEGYHIESTREQDTIMREEFIKKADTEYNFFTNNCATIVQEVMVKAGIAVSKPEYKVSSTIMSTPFGTVETYNNMQIKCNINIIPSLAFRSIIRWNPTGVLYHKQVTNK